VIEAGPSLEGRDIPELVNVFCTHNEISRAPPAVPEIRVDILERLGLVREIWTLFQNAKDDAKKWEKSSRLDNYKAKRRRPRDDNGDDEGGDNGDNGEGDEDDKPDGHSTFGCRTRSVLSRAKSSRIDSSRSKGCRVGDAPADEDGHGILSVSHTTKFSNPNPKRHNPQYSRTKKRRNSESTGTLTAKAVHMMNRKSRRIAGPNDHNDTVRKWLSAVVVSADPSELQTPRRALDSSRVSLAFDEGCRRRADNRQIIL
jgi:hypothetical protein